ncbi:MAG: hypothetical protein M3437_03880 [Chloroflexota bacterium]|nr:hypothetical protein [Chloroflexota bacterium]MDQ5865791.1 hypothetical protein [Chloroflexota bacterium]
MRLKSGFLTVFGLLWEWLIQRWVAHTGRAVEAESVPWLAGPTGAHKIGESLYESYARDAGLVIQRRPDAGLLESFAALRSSRFDPDKVHPAVHDFYEKTARYSLEAWVQWTGPLSPFARIMISSISRNIEQLVLPLSPLTTSRGMSSEIISLAREQTGLLAYSGWLRKTVATGEIIYAGFYTTCKPPRYPGRCVKVVFPLPQGSATVILRPVNGPNGSFKLVSEGRKFGGPGYYRVHRVHNRELRVKYVPIEETIHVYVDDAGVLRTDHHFNFWGLRFLTLHYKITRKQPQE